jgi:hypothetical protein
MSEDTSCHRVLVEEEGFCILQEHISHFTCTAAEQQQQAQHSGITNVLDTRVFDDPTLVDGWLREYADAPVVQVVTCIESVTLHYDGHARHTKSEHRLRWLTRYYARK